MAYYYLSARVIVMSTGGSACRPKTSHLNNDSEKGIWTKGLDAG